MNYPDLTGESDMLREPQDGATTTTEFDLLIRGGTEIGRAHV